LPLRYRHGYAAGLHRGLPAGKTNPAQEFPTRNGGRVRTAIQPRSTGFELAEVLRSFTSLVPLVHLPDSLARPAPSGSSGTSRRCRGCSPPVPVVSPEPAAPSFNHSAATERWCGSSTHTRTHSASWRTVSHPHPALQRLMAHQIPFPVPGNGPIFSLRRTLTDHHLSRDELLAPTSGPRAGNPQGMARAQARGQIAPWSAPRPST